MADLVRTGCSGLSFSSNPLTANQGGMLDLRNMICDRPGWAIKRRGLKRLGGPSLPAGPAPEFYTVFSLGTPANYQIVDAWFYDDHLFVYAEQGSSFSGIAAYAFVSTYGWHKVTEQAGQIAISERPYRMAQCSVDRRQLISTAAGVKRIASIYADNYPTDAATPLNYSTMYRDAGVPRALDPRCRNAVAGGGTDHGLFAITGFEWLLLSSAVAYRVAWFKRDENGIPNISMPSGRVVIRNTSTTTNYAVRLKIPIPSGVADSSYVLQIYRTNIVQMDGTGVIPDPGDEMFLAGEYKLTSTDLSNKYVLYEDVSFDTLLGADLYSNESQDGPTQVRAQPPVARDIANFGGSAFYSNVTERQRLTIKILAVDSSGIGTFKGVRVGDAIVVGDLVMVGSTTANEEVNAWNFAVDGTTGVGSEVIRCIKTAESLAYKYNMWSNANNGRYAAYCMTSNNDIVGIVQLEEKGVGGSTGVYMSTNRVDAPVQILPNCQFTSSPSNTLAQPCQVDTNAGPTLVTLTYGANHNLTTGDLIFLAPFANSTASGTSSPRCVNTHVPSGVYKVTVTGATTVTFPAPSGSVALATDARAGATGAYAHKIFDVTNSIWTEARSKQARLVSRLMWSSTFEPENAPPLNSVDIGDASKAILRIVPTVDSLFIFKEDGLWRLKGAGGDWEIIAIDSSCVLASPTTPAVVLGSIYALSVNGIVAVDDGGVKSISVNIGSQLDEHFRSIMSYDQSAHPVILSGCAHGEDQAYWITMSTMQDQVTTVAGDAYRYHVPTRTWSRHFFANPTAQLVPSLWSTSPTLVGTPISKIITAKASRRTSADDQAYLERLVVCSGIPGNVMSFIGIERRSGRAIDNCDCEVPVTVSSFDTSANTVACSSSLGGAQAGDVFLWYGNATYVPGGYALGDPETQYRAVITNVNGSVITLQIAGQTPPLNTWPAIGAGQSGSIMKRIRSAHAYMPIMETSNIKLAHFSEAIVSVGANARWSKIEFMFATDVNRSNTNSILHNSADSSLSGYATESWSNWLTCSDFLSSALIPFKTGVPRTKSTGQYLIVCIRHDRAWEIFDVAGIRVIYNAGDDRLRRTNA